MPRVGRTVLVLFLATVLLLSLISANLAVGLDRTVLDRDFVKDSLAEENAYAVLEDEVTRQLSSAGDDGAGGESSAGGGTSGEVPNVDRPPVDEVMSSVITRRYVRQQTERNVDNVYDFLHGETNEFRIELDTRPIKDGVVEETEQLVLETDVGEYDEQLGQMAEGPQEYQEARAEFKEDRKERIQEETDRELSDEELEAQYDDRREVIRSELRDELEARAAEQDTREQVQEAQVELGMVRVNGLLEADKSYAEFMSDLEDAKASLATAVANAVERQLDQELPDTLVVTEDMDQGAQQTLETAQTVVSIFGILVLVLPLLSLALAGLIVLIAPARDVGLMVVGAVTTLAGVASVAAVSVIDGTVSSEIDSMIAAEDVSRNVGSLLLGLIDRLLGAFSGQSWLLVAIGVLLIAVGVALRRDLLPTRAWLGDEPGPAGVDSGTETAERELDAESGEGAPDAGDIAEGVSTEPDGPDVDGDTPAGGS